MKRAFAALALLAMIADHAAAQMRAQDEPPSAPLELPGVTVTAPRASPGANPGGGHASGANPCTNVQAGTPLAYDCLNHKLKGQVEQINPPAIVVPTDAASLDIKKGIVNFPAVKQQYGKNFGVSVYPYRPPRPTYTAPLRR